MKTTLLSTGLVLASLMSQVSVAQNVEVKVTNLMQSTNITPLLIAAHSTNLNFYDLGAPASLHLQMTAEGGDISGLIADADAAGANYVANPAAGRLAPGASTVATVVITNSANQYLSVAAMLIPTNDGFVGADAIKIPAEPGTYTYYLNGYDAGTEANNEIIVSGAGAPGIPGIPGDPTGYAGTGGTGVIDHEVNTMVHVHPGQLGDLDETGGFSDLDSRVHSWLNPVAKLEITVTCDTSVKGTGKQKSCEK